MPPVIGLRRDLARDMPYFGMPVDDGFDFFRMNLEAADIDDAAAPSDEMVAVAAQLDHVAGIDEALASASAAAFAADIGMRGPRRADPERSVFDFHFDAIAVLPDHGCRENPRGRH